MRVHVAFLTSKACEMKKTPEILIIYTGGTIGMVINPATGSLAPFDFEHISKQVPELSNFGFHLTTLTFNPLIDSSNIQPSDWIKLATAIHSNYDKYDGFVILHGTDTMSYTASALSFMLDQLSKPVIITGSQLPIGTLRTDGKENLISSVEIAAAQHNGQALVPEVAIYFENFLYRGNRTTKYNAEYFNAFRSENYPHLAKAGINIHYNHRYIHYPTTIKPLSVHTRLDARVAILKIFPGISPDTVKAITQIPGLRGLVLETYGAGNAPSSEWFLHLIKQSVDKGLIALNISQCASGSVDMGKYETGLGLKNAGVISGYDSTTEAALTKLMFLLGQNLTPQEVKAQLACSLRGEITV